MMETAQGALFRAVYQRLMEGERVWTSVHPDMATLGAQRPYVVFHYVGGGELNQQVKPDAELVLSVKVVADALETALLGAAQLSERLNDADYGSEKQMNGGADWDILHSKQEQAIHLLEMVNDTERRYHAGHRFRFRMESK